MKRRTTLELDDKLLSRAQRVLGARTMRETIEEALRQVVARSESKSEPRRRAQLAYLRGIVEHADVEVLQSEDMWR